MTKNLSSKKNFAGILAVLPVAFALASSNLRAEIIIAYEAGTNGVPAIAPDPTSPEGGGWTSVDTTGGSTNYLSIALSPDPVRTSLNAWRFLDGSTATSQSQYFKKAPTAEQVQKAMWAGWKASCYYRVRDDSLGHAGAMTMFFQFGSANSLMNKRYIVYADLDEEGALYASAVGAPTRRITTDPNATLAYHLYEMRYDSATRSVDLYVDGSLLMTNLPSFSAAIDGAAFGNGSPGGFGDGYYNFVKVEVNDLTPTTVTLDPHDATVDVGASHTFTAGFTGGATALQWYFNDSPVPGANGRSLAIPCVTPDSAGVYKLGIYDPQAGAEVLTQGATLTVNPDSTSPAVASVKPVPTMEHVRVRFSEGLDTSTAQDTANYSFLENALDVVSANLVDLRTVELRTSIQKAGTNYTLVVKGVQDLSHNTMAQSTNTFSVATTTPVYYHAGVEGNPAQAPDPADPANGHWTFVKTGNSPLVFAAGVSPDVNGLNAWNLTDSSSASTTYNLEYRWAFPQATREFAQTNGWCYRVFSRFVDNFGGGTKAVLINYGDVAQARWLLWFNSVGIGPDLAVSFDAGATAYVTDGSGALDYHTHDLVYDPETQAVNYYYDGILTRSNWPGTFYSSSAQNGPHFAVANQTGKGSMNFNSIEFRVNASSDPLSFKTHPVGATLPYNAPLVLRAQAAGFVGGYQWYRDGVAIAGATASQYVIYQLTQSLVGTYTLKAFNSQTQVESDPAVVALMPPTVAITPINGTNLLVSFSGILQSAATLADTFADVSPAPKSPVILTNAVGPGFYRARY